MLWPKRTSFWTATKRRKPSMTSQTLRTGWTAKAPHVSQASRRVKQDPFSTRRSSSRRKAASPTSAAPPSKRSTRRRRAKRKILRPFATSATSAATMILTECVPESCPRSRGHGSTSCFDARAKLHLDRAAAIILLQRIVPVLRIATATQLRRTSARRFS